MSSPYRLALWSGPRNISTALMRSWENRPDTAVCDEPLYAYYLQQTGLDHPGRDEILAHHEPDAARVIAFLTGPVPGGKAIFYQKHMAHHLVDGLPLDWLDDLQHGFLLREPRAMLTSLLQVLPEAALSETGLPQQVDLFDRVRAATGRTPPVIDARDVLEAPEPMLRALCAAFGVPFQPAMLHWPPGPRSTDGIWAKHWYARVEQSTGFAPYRPKPDAVPDDRRELLAACRELYEYLYRFRLSPSE